MGDFTLFPKELLIEIFKFLAHPDLAPVAIVNWTCKEVVERNTEWGERKRFFRILPSLFQHISFAEKTESYPIPSWTLQQIQQTLTDTRRPTQELSQLLHHYLNVRSGGTGFWLVDNGVMMTYSLVTPLEQPFTIILFYEIDLQKESPHLRQPAHFYRLDTYQKKLQQIAFSDLTTVVHELDFNENAARVTAAGSRGNRLFVRYTGYDIIADDNPDKNFLVLQAINKDTLQVEASYSFYPFPETPLPSMTASIYLDHKFCVMISEKSCVIKMGKSTLRVDQERLKPLFGMMINHLSIQNRSDGQMEVTLEGVNKEQAIRMHHTTDPFYPMFDQPAPRSRYLFWMVIAAVIAGLAIMIYRRTKT